MTVQKLVELLEEEDQQLEVQFMDSYGSIEITSVRRIEYDHKPIIIIE